jgi:GntR family transcriptional regulator
MPLYREIAEDLRRQIDSGELTAGSKLPTEPELRERYAASRNTVRDAIKTLMTLTLVETRPGQGTFVIAKPEPVVIRLGSHPETGLVGDSLYYAAADGSGGRSVEVSSPRVEVRRADGVVAGKLQLEKGGQLISRHQQRYISSVPWSLQTSFYPMALVGAGATRLLDADDIALGTDQYLAETLSIRPVGGDEWLAVRPPDTNEAAFFGLPEDGRVSVVESIRTGYDQNGRPVRVTATVYPADRHQFVITPGAVPMPVLGDLADGAPDPAQNQVADDRAPAIFALER